MKTRSLFLPLWSVCLVIALLTACTDSTDQTADSAPEASGVSEPQLVSMPLPTNTPAAATATSVPATLNPVQIALTAQLLTAEVATPRPTPTPQPESCAEIEGSCIAVIYESGTCNYVGAAEYGNEPIALLFSNQGPGDAGPVLWRIIGNHTVQDFIDQPLTRYRWTTINQVVGITALEAGQHYLWQLNLEPATYIVECIRHYDGQTIDGRVGDSFTILP